MRTCAEVLQWCAGAAEELGDPSAAVCQLFVRWVDDLVSFEGEELVCGMDAGDIVLWLGPGLLFPLSLQTGGPQIEDDELKSFGAELITPGVWALEPSLNVPATIHGFLVLYGVPDPAPWERRIVLP